MYFYDWTDAIAQSLNEVWLGIADFIPALLGGLIVFIVGLIVATGLGHLVERVLVATKIDSIVGRTGLDKEFERSGLRFSISRFFGRLTYWFFLIVTVIAVMDILFPAVTVTEFISELLAFIPQVAAAVIIMLGAVLLGNFLKGIVQASVLAAKLHAAKALAALAWWAVVVFGFLAALNQLGIGAFVTNVVQILIMGLALAFGLAFGLGGKEYAAHLLSKFREQTESKR